MADEPTKNTEHKSRFAEALQHLAHQRQLRHADMAASVGLTRAAVSKWMRGEAIPGVDTIELLIAKLDLSLAEADRLRQASGLYPALPPLRLPLAAEDQTLRQIVDAVLDLRRTRPEQAAFVETAILMFLEGAQASPLPQVDVPAHLVPRRVSLGPLERAVEGILDRPVLSRAKAPAPTSAQFDLLLRVARSEAWESKRLIAHALPGLLAQDAAQARPLLEVLREDPPHPFWRTDIRRRAVEALPALYPHDPAAALALLRPQPDDEVYTAIAALEALAGLPAVDDRAADGRAADSDAVRAQILAAWPADGDGAALHYHAALLDQCRADPAAALETMRQHCDGYRLERICTARALALTLPAGPAESLALLRHFLRRGERRRPVEHQNVRRAVVRTVARTLAAGTLPLEPAADVLELLASDEDVHTRRGLVDALPHLLRQDPAAAMHLVNRIIIHD
ncbi:MAG: helix-turn-helix domain-containing protein, partial [Chloroflexi bacterium]|nr:helix-turn-helix domain-containing protein [Chloroflexota bacterium]